MDNLPYTAPGPIFEPGPGWGGRLKKWSKKYILGWDCTLCQATRFVLLFGIIFIIIFWPKLNSSLTKQSVSEPAKITETVQPKDGKIRLARRILVKYLNQNTAAKLSAGQKVFIETTLQEKITANSVNQIGSQVELDSLEIKKVIDQANLLSPLQLKKWEGYAQRINF